MAGVHVDVDASTAQGWIVKIIAFVISMCFVGVCVWVATTTFKNDTQLQLINQKFDTALQANSAETSKLTSQLVGVADQLSEVSNHLAQVSANLYTKDDAAKEAQRVNAELESLRLKQAQLQGSIDFNKPRNRYTQ